MPQSVESQIQISTTDNPLIYGISVTGESLQEFTAERFINRLVINTANPFVNAAGEEWYMDLWDGSYQIAGLASPGAQGGRVR